MMDDIYKNDKNLVSTFNKYNEKYFEGALKFVNISWSDRMTLCTGKTYLLKHKKSCFIKLSKPLLSQRPYKDAINTLLHEMIHAFLFLTKGQGSGNEHGKDFIFHMKRINNLEGSKIRICHNFHKEVNKFRVNIYHCNGPCRFRKPFFGVLRRAILRPPGPEDKWWGRHREECGGTFIKVSGHDKKIEEIHHPNTSKLISFKDEKIIMKNKPERTKGNFNANYVSSIKRLNLHKYIYRYFKYNENLNKKLSITSGSKKDFSKLREHINLTVEKYVLRMKKSLKK